MSSGASCRDLTTPGGSVVTLTSPQRLALSLCLVARAADALKVSGCRSASFGLWHDVINLNRWRYRAAAVARLAQVFVTRQRRTAQPAPWPATTTAPSIAAYPGVRHIGMIIAVAVALACQVAAQLGAAR